MPTALLLTIALPILQESVSSTVKSLANKNSVAALNPGMSYAVTPILGELPSVFPSFVIVIGSLLDNMSVLACPTVGQVNDEGLIEIALVAANVNVTELSNPVAAVLSSTETVALHVPGA